MHEAFIMEVTDPYLLDLIRQTENIDASVRRVYAVLLVTNVLMSLLLAKDVYDWYTLADKVNSDDGRV